MPLLFIPRPGLGTCIEAWRDKLDRHHLLARIPDPSLPSAEFIVYFLEDVMTLEVRMEALSSQEMAEKAEAVGVRKAALPFLSLFALAVLAGAFIGLGAMFATTTAAATSTLPYGVARLLIGLVFCLGLILVVVAGAELFTGNNLIVMAWANRKISTWALLRNWLIVYAVSYTHLTL